jgi:hypothetical protein
MKKILALTLSLASIIFVASAAEAKVKGSSVSTTTTIAANSLQTQWRFRNRRNNRVARTFTQTRLVRYGRQIYRETYLVRYLPNGRTQARLISRVRVR